MKHSQLLILRERLIRLNLDGLTDEAIKRLHSLAEIMKDFEGDEACETMDRTLASAAEMIAATNSLGFGYLQEIAKDIRNATIAHIEDDNDYWAGHGARFKTAKYIREYQQLPVTADAKKMILARIGFYTDWKYPGLEIGPGDGEWTESLVACDPLYLIDYNEEFLTATKKKFSGAYQARLRCYTNGGEGLHMLPKEQFGFVFSWNTFNYFSFSQINNWLNEIYGVLRPGGACMFSYNNVERPICSVRAEDHLMSFVPKCVLWDTLKQHGFINIKTEDTDSALSWVEFRKPGKLKSNRTGQTLGKIILAAHVKA